MRPVGVDGDPRDFLAARLAALSASTWEAIAREAFAGALVLETANTRYTFQDATLVLRENAGGDATPIPGTRGLRLIGFLTCLQGLWSFSTAWAPGASAVLVRTDGPSASFFLTSGTLSRTHAAPELPRPRASRPPRLAAPPPPSLTRVIAAPAAPAR